MIKHITIALLKAFVGFLMGMAFYFSLLVIWWQFGSYQTADVTVPMTVLNENKEVKQGEPLQLSFVFTKYTQVTPQVSRNVLCADDTVHLAFTIQNNNNNVARPIGTFTATTSYILSDSVPLDTTCFFEFTNEYQVNPIKRITKNWFSEPFIVKE